VRDRAWCADSAAVRSTRCRAQRLLEPPLRPRAPRLLIGAFEPLEVALYRCVVGGIAPHKSFARFQALQFCRQSRYRHRSTRSAYIGTRVDQTRKTLDHTFHGELSFDTLARAAPQACSPARVLGKHPQEARQCLIEGTDVD